MWKTNTEKELEEKLKMLSGKVDNLFKRLKYTEFLVENPPKFKHGDKVHFAGEQIFILNEKSIEERCGIPSFDEYLAVFDRIYYASKTDSPVNVIEVWESNCKKI